MVGGIKAQVPATRGYVTVHGKKDPVDVITDLKMVKLHWIIHVGPFELRESLEQRTSPVVVRHRCDNRNWSVRGDVRTTGLLKVEERDHKPRSAGSFYSWKGRQSEPSP